MKNNGKQAGFVTKSELFSTKFVIHDPTFQEQVSKCKLGFFFDEGHRSNVEVFLFFGTRFRNFGAPPKPKTIFLLQFREFLDSVDREDLEFSETRTQMRQVRKKIKSR